MSYNGIETSLGKLYLDDYYTSKPNKEVSFDAHFEYEDKGSDFIGVHFLESTYLPSRNRPVECDYCSAMENQLHGNINDLKVEQDHVDQQVDDTEVETFPEDIITIRQNIAVNVDPRGEDTNFNNVQQHKHEIKREALYKASVAIRQNLVTDLTRQSTGSTRDNDKHEHKDQQQTNDLLIMTLKNEGKMTTETKSLNDDKANCEKHPTNCEGSLDFAISLHQYTKTTKSSQAELKQPLDVNQEYVTVIKDEETECRVDENREVSSSSKNEKQDASISSRNYLLVPKNINSSNLLPMKPMRERVKSPPQKDIYQEKSVKKRKENFEQNGCGGMQDNEHDIIEFCTLKKRTEDIKDNECKEDNKTAEMNKRWVVDDRDGRKNDNTRGSGRECTTGKLVSQKQEIKTNKLGEKDVLVSEIHQIKEGSPNVHSSRRRLPSLGSTAMIAYYSEDYFKQFERKNLSEQRELKKHFKSKITEARKTLREARKKAKEQTVARRFDEAVRKHKEMQRRRLSTRNSSALTASVTPTRNSIDAKKRLTNAIADVMKNERIEVRKIHQAEAQLGRATVAKRSKERSTMTERLGLISTPATVKSRMRRDRERMERYEVEYLISELRFLNMEEYAVKLAEALKFKEELETTLRSQLAQKRKLAVDMAKRRKLEEQARIREEERIRRLEEKERRERERKEREALEQEQRRLKAIKRREHNLKLWEHFNYTMLATDKSRSFTYSYLPTLKSPVKEEKPKRVKLKDVQSRYRVALESKKH